MPDFFVGAWTVLLAPKGTPDAIMRKVHNDMRIVLDDPEIRAKLALNGGYVRHMTPAEAHRLRAERAEDLAADPGDRWRRTRRSK